MTAEQDAERLHAAFTNIAPAAPTEAAAPSAPADTCKCRHPQDRHVRLSGIYAHCRRRCGCGMYRPQDDEPAETDALRTDREAGRRETAAASAPADQTERRDRYAAAMAKRDGHEWPTEFEDDERDYRRRADAAMAVADAEIEHLRKERDAFRDQRNGVFATNEQLLAQVEESGLARIRAENEARTAKRAAAAPSPAYRRLLARLEADRASHLRATEQAKEAGETELLLVSSTFAAALRHAAARVIAELEGPDAAQAYMQRTEGGEEVVVADDGLRDRIAEALVFAAEVVATSGPGAANAVQAVIDRVQKALAVLPEPHRPFDTHAGLQRLADDLQRGETAELAELDREGAELVCVDECGSCDACGMEPFGTPAEGWREAARFLRRTPRDSADFLGAIRGARLIEDELRRMADEAQQADTAGEA